MEKLKQTLINLDLVEDNDWLDLYCKLIYSNYNTKHEKFKTQKHHIIPKYYYKLHKLDVNNSSENTINLLYKDHILAHYYLALCAKHTAFKYGMECAIIRLLSEYTVPNDTIDFVKALDEYQSLYTDYCNLRSIKMKNRTVSAETRKKISMSLQGKKRGPMSQSCKDKISIANKGKKRSQEVIAKLAMQTKGKTPWNKGLTKETDERVNTYCKNNSSMWSVGHIPWNKGKSFSDETKLKMSISAKNKPAITDETRKKLSEAAKRRVLNNKEKNEK